MSEKQEAPTPTPMLGSLDRDIAIEIEAAKTGLDWDAALAHLCDARKKYLDNNDTWQQDQQMLAACFTPLTDRWHSGERTPELHAAMLDLR